MDAGIVPVKRLTEAKARLTDHLGGNERLELARALLEDALDLCVSFKELRWWVVSDDETVLEAARRRDLAVVVDDGRGLNAALSKAVTTVSGAGATSVTVIPSDVPLAWKGDLQDLLDTGATSDVVVVPSERDGGTNALYLSPPDLMEPRFGRASLHAHIGAAERLGVRCSILTLPRLGLDLDTIEDADEIVRTARPGSSRAVEVLQKLGRPVT